MLSSRFLALSSLYLFYAAGLVAAVPGNQFGGGDQSCEVRPLGAIHWSTLFAYSPFDR